jgi:hypothetical protein
MSYVDQDAFAAAVEEFGPKYPALPSVDKHRRLARSAVEETPEQRRAYGAAVHAGIRALQRSELMRVVSVPKPNCASGTAETEGRKILNAVKRQLEAKLQADANADRRRRTDGEIIAAYQAAMEAKRAREGGPAPVAVPAPAPEQPAPVVESEPEAMPEPAAPMRMRARKMPKPVTPGPDSPVIYYSTVKAPKAGRWSSYRAGRVIASMADGRDLSCHIGGGYDYTDDALGMARTHAENLAANLDLFPQGAHVRMRKEAGGRGRSYRCDMGPPEPAELPLSFRRESLRQLPPPRSQAAWRRLSHMIRSVRREHGAGYGDVQGAGSFYASREGETPEPVRAGWNRYRMHNCETLAKIRTEPEPVPFSYGRRRARGFFDKSGSAPDRPSRLERAKAYLARRRGSGAGTGEGPVPLPDVGRPYVLLQASAKPRIRVKAISRPHVVASSAHARVAEPAPTSAVVVPRMRVPLHLLASASAVAYARAA